ncbi:MAG: hypothetical protein HYY37_06230 [Candidatus Aenigmarchaeota archaeon]|nr:hypothetical protein [Candidatus Aenigmarchaeota archaeon]
MGYSHQVFDSINTAFQVALRRGRSVPDALAMALAGVLKSYSLDVKYEELPIEMRMIRDPATNRAVRRVFKDPAYRSDMERKYRTLLD